MKMNDLILVLICSALAAVYFVVLPLGPMWLRVPIDVLVGLFILWEGIVLTVKYCELFGYLTGAVFALFLIGKLTEYGLIEPAL